VSVAVFDGAGQFFGTTIFLLSLSSAMTVGVIKLHFSGEHGARVPAWLLNCIARCLRLDISDEGVGGDEWRQKRVNETSGFGFDFGRGLSLLWFFSFLQWTKCDNAIVKRFVGKVSDAVFVGLLLYIDQSSEFKYTVFVLQLSLLRYVM